MSWKQHRFSLAAFAILCVVALPSCGHQQQLVGITIQPAAETFGAPDPTLNVQLRALGSYIHPPVTKDITGQVTWSSNTPQVATVTAAGLLAPPGIDACGGSLVSATVTTNNSGAVSSSGALVTAFMNVTVNNLLVQGCPGFAGGGGSQPVLTVAFLGAGNGSVVSSPAGINCASACSGIFTSGTPVILTATPDSGSVFVSWVGCDTTNGPVCNVTVNNSVTVTVTFN